MPLLMLTAALALAIDCDAHAVGVESPEVGAGDCESDGAADTEPRGPLALSENDGVGDPRSLALAAPLAVTLGDRDTDATPLAVAASEPDAASDGDALAPPLCVSALDAVAAALLGELAAEVDRAPLGLAAGETLAAPAGDGDGAPDCAADALGATLTDGVAPPDDEPLESPPVALG